MHHKHDLQYQYDKESHCEVAQCQFVHLERFIVLKQLQSQQGDGELRTQCPCLRAWERGPGYTSQTTSVSLG